MIKDKFTQEIIPFELNWTQALLVKHVIADLEAGRPVRYIILKARQMGISTVIEALCYWWTATHRNITSVIIAHETDASSNLYKMFRRYYDYTHPNFQVDRKYNTRKDIVFDVEDNIKAEIKAHVEVCKDPNTCGEPHRSPGLSSEIKTMIAKEGKGRSDTINFFHGSEVAFWEASADIISSALQAVPLAPGTFEFLESTANGVGGYFYDEWQLAKKGESAFKPLFFAWHEHWEYELPAEDVMNYDDEEQELIEIFRQKGYPIESWSRKITWRRAKKKEFRTDPAKFYQEYPKDDMEAFLASGRPVFDIKQLMKMEEAAQRPENQPRFGHVILNPDTSAKEKYIFQEIAKSFQDQDPTPLKVWELPEDDKYVIAIDSSEGKLESSSAGKENDYSVIDVMNVKTLKTAARWRGHIDPDLLGDVAFELGTFYNNALIGPEINNHGLVVAQKLRNRFYRNLYQRETSEEEQFQERTSKMGWRTDKKTKPMMVDYLGSAIREGDIIDYDIVFIRECMTYVRDDQGFTNAQEGMFDDTVMAKAINLQLAAWNSYDKGYAKEHISKPIKRNKNASTTGSNSDLDSIAAGHKRPANADVILRRRQSRQRHKISNHRR